MPVLRAAGIEPEEAFADEDARQLRFSTNVPGLDLIRVRSFDVATFVAFGAAHLGVAGNDVLMEFDYPGDLRAARPRPGPLPAVGLRAARSFRRGRSAYLESHPHRHQVSRVGGAPFRRPRRAGRMHRAEWRDGTRAGAGPDASGSSIWSRPGRRWRPTAWWRSNASPRSPRGSPSIERHGRRGRWRSAAGSSASAR